MMLPAQTLFYGRAYESPVYYT